MHLASLMYQKISYTVDCAYYNYYSYYVEKWYPSLSCTITSTVNTVIILFEILVCYILCIVGYFIIHNHGSPKAFVENIKPLLVQQIGGNNCDSLLLQPAKLPCSAL